MRVVHVGKFYPPEYHGGLESVVAGLNAELVRRGIGVSTVVAAVRGPTRAEQVEGVRVVRARTLATLLSQPVAPRLAALVRGEPGEVLHLHHPNPLGDLAVLGDPRPLVITQHSDIVRQRALAPLYGPLLRRVYARAAVITVGSAPYRDSSRELALARERTRIIPFGIDAARFALTAPIRDRVAALRAAWGPDPAVLAVGRLVTYKGFEVLVAAARGLGARVVIVGSGPEEPRLRAAAGPEVIFAGRVTDDALVAHFHACDLFCLPSITRAEAFGMVLLEAMACGKPLVTTALPTGVSVINRDGDTGLVVPPGDAGALRAALEALAADPARRAAMGRRARDVVEREYSAALMGERFAELYAEVAGAAVGRSGGQAVRRSGRS